MGAEELKKRRPSHEKYIDRQRVLLSTPDLFTQTPADRPRSAIATLANGASASLGEQFVIEASDDGIMLGRRGNAIVCKFMQPPADIFNAVRNGAGVASGEVQRVNALSGTVEVTIR